MPARLRKTKTAPLEGLFGQHLAADGSEAINAFAEIDRFGGDQDAALRGELDHQGVSKNVRTNAATGGVDSW